MPLKPMRERRKRRHLLGKSRRRPCCKAARQLQDVQANWAGPDNNMHQALLFNRRLWSIFMSAAETNDNPQPLEIRQNIANIGVFVMKQTLEMQINPDPAKLKSLIDINCNLAAGLSGRV